MGRIFFLRIIFIIRKKIPDKVGPGWKSLSYPTSAGSPYTSRELLMRFQCKGSCKGPYTLTTVLDYNARYNKTLKSFFINTTMMKMAYGSYDLMKAYGCCYGHSIFFWNNMVYITLILLGDLLVNKGGQGTLR